MDAKVRRRAKKAILNAGTSEAEADLILLELDKFADEQMKKVGDFVGQFVIESAERGDGAQYLMAALGFFMGEVMSHVGIETMRKFLSISLDQVEKGFHTPAGLMWDKKRKN